MNNNVVRFVELHKECPVYTGHHLDRNLDCSSDRDLVIFGPCKQGISWWGFNYILTWAKVSSRDEKRTDSDTNKCQELEEPKAEKVQIFICNTRSC